MSTESLEGFRLSPQQEHIVEAARQPTYPVAACLYSCSGTPAVETLQRALTTVVARHEILRTVFRRHRELKLPLQMILPDAALELRVEDLSLLLSEAREAELRRRFEAATQKRVSAGDTPVLVCTLFELGENRSALLVAAPSLCMDAASFLVLAQQLQDTLAGDAIAGDPLQYVDATEWQHDLLDGTEDAALAAKAFWKTQAHTPLLLPLESVCDARAGDTVLLPVPHVDREALARAAQQAGVSLADLLLTVWHLLLSRLSGEAETPVLAYADGRDYDEIKDAIGLFARFLPMSFEASGTTCIDERARKVAASSKHARNQQDWFTPGSATAQPAIGFEYHDLRGAIHAGPGRSAFAPLAVRVCLEDLKLRLIASDLASGLDLELEYQAERYTHEFMEQMALSLVSLLTQIAEDPRRELQDLSLLAGPEQRERIAIGTGPVVPIPSESMHTLISTQAARTPEAIAVRSGEDWLTYAELEARSNCLARYLVGCGVGPGSLVWPGPLVGLCVARSAAMMVPVLAILKAGAAYVPLSADQPRARTEQQLAGIEVLITESAFVDQLPAFAGRMLLLDGPERPWEQEPATDPAVEIPGDALAYVIYTSGSTGTPKGVGVRHRNLVNYASHIVSALGLEAGLQYATVSTLAADLGNTVIYPALITGGCLHVLPYDVATDARRMAAYQAQYGIDVLKIVPSHLAALLDADADAGLGVLPSKYLITGGEALKPALVERLAGSRCAVINHYGPTETTVGSLMLPLNDFDWKHAPLTSIPIGRPIANTRVYVLDANLQLVPVGVAGELYIAGAGVTAGYIGQPEKTVERFLADPFANDAVMYRTGDLVRWLPQGLVEFLGRTDDQVKIRGYRVELGEIESVLAAQPGVRQCVVVARTKPHTASDQADDRQVVAYVVLDRQQAVPDRQQAVTLESLKEALKDRLPDYMVPGAFVELKKLPLTANGKIDRKQLPEPEERASHAYRAPATSTEELVAQIWAEVLKVDRLSTDENFFDLGGHSLLATQVISRIRRVLGVDLPLRTMFDAPTVSRIAQQVEQARLPGGAKAPPTIVALPRVGSMPLSFAQQRLWILDQMEPNNSLYNIPRTIRLGGDLNVAALTHSLNEIVRRHEPLRTWFGLEDGQPVQHILSTLKLEVETIDLTDVAVEEREAKAHAIAAREAATPLDLSRAPLLRVVLLRLAPTDHVLLLTMHHIVSDAWSAAIFMDELRALYASFLAGTQPDLPELASQYADYATWQRNWLTGDTLAKQLAFWRDQLAGAPPVLALPTDRPRPEKPTFAGALLRHTLPPELCAPLNALCRKEGVTLFMALLAIFQTLLARVANQQQVVVGTDSANRFTVETERMIGFFINLLALKADFDGDPTFREVLGRVRETTLACYARQEMPFDKIVEELRPDRKLSHNPIVQVLFVMQNAPSATRQLGNLQIGSFHVPLTRSKFDLAWFATDRGESIEVVSVYSTELFDESTVKSMLHSFEALLADAVGNPETRVSGLNLYSEEQKQKLKDERVERKQSSRDKLMSAGVKAFIPEIKAGE